MNYMKKFKSFESVIIPDTINDDGRIENITDLKDYGERNGFDVFLYDDFYNSLSENNKKEAPPRSAPFFAIFHPIRKRPMFVVGNEMLIGRMINKELVNDIIGHERIHSEQSRRKVSIDYKLPSPLDRKSYFSNKEEIMAFSWTIANDISKKANNFEEAKISFINSSNRIWGDIKKICDEKTIKRYKKYIYLYLEKIFTENED